MFGKSPPETEMETNMEPAIPSANTSGSHKKNNFQFVNNVTAVNKVKTNPLDENADNVDNSQAINSLL
eukprot:CAMPEP_0176455242 /NCGR_PEP_ID=MMETSP0127-20121128/30492_1 /TAXON_ID=938130 /ORGANISM="Platyophrya macrostoma, Strain WH" /LENGTH=67 /DNA_ID=CAMNT_0017844805 /DNA_START=1 /DNA_END=200 /DNA_ORIENTATION=-